MPRYEATGHASAVRISNVQTTFRIAGWFGLFFALYLFFAGKMSPAEVAAGAGSAAIATLAVFGVRQHRSHNFSVRLNWSRNLANIPLRILRDCAIVVAAICRRPSLDRGTGRFNARPFHHGEERPLVRTRRALVTLAISISPNSFVAEANADRDEILVHELIPRNNAAPNEYWPV